MTDVRSRDVLIPLEYLSILGQILQISELGVILVRFISDLFSIRQTSSLGTLELGVSQSLL